MCVVLVLAFEMLPSVGSRNGRDVAVEPAMSETEEEDDMASWEWDDPDTPEVDLVTITLEIEAGETIADFRERVRLWKAEFPPYDPGG